MVAQCSRCSSPAVVFAPDARCVSCFKAYLFRAFKTSLGRLGAGGRRKSIALALSGGASSAALALLFHNYFQSLTPNPNVPPTQVFVVHVSTPKQQESKLITELCQLLSAKLLSAELPRMNVKDVTDLMSLRQIQLNDTILRLVQEQGCDTVLFGTSATRTAVDVLHSCITARGTSVRNAATAAVQYGSVRVVRPLRDIPVRHLTRYTLLYYPEIPVVSEDRSHGLYGSTERFIGQVAADNPSSVHNVVKTAAKLLPAKGPKCDFCNAVVQDCEEICDDCDCKSFLCPACSDCQDRGGEGINRMFQEKKDKRRRREGREAMFKQIEQFVL